MEVRKPKIKVISHDEVYLLDNEDNVIKRICGAKREGIPEEFPCTNNAGEGTKHEGAGRCLIHDKALSKHQERNTYTILIDKDKPRTILDYLTLSTSLDSNRLKNVDSEIQLLESSIASVLEKHKDTMTMKTAKELSQIIEKLGRLKQIKIDSDKKIQLDFGVVTKLIKGVMLAVKMHINSPEVFRRIISDILVTTINPMMASGDLSPGNIDEIKVLPKLNIKELNE